MNAALPARSRRQPINVIPDGRGYRWRCTVCAPGRSDESVHMPSFLLDMFSSRPVNVGYGPTLAQAADAGRDHWRRHHAGRQDDYALAADN